MKFEEYVGIFIGRFQGLTIGHAKVIDIMDKTHPQNYVVLMRGDGTSSNLERNPFPFSVQQKMIKKLLGPNTDLVVTSNLEDLLFKLDGRKFAIYSGLDRVHDYRRYAASVTKDGYIVEVLETELMVPRDDNISGTKFRQALRDDDIETFKKITPEKIWPMYEELREYV